MSIAELINNIVFLDLFLGSVPEIKIEEQDQNLAFLVMDCLTLLLHENGDNASKYTCMEVTIE